MAEEPFRAEWTARVIDASGTQVVDDLDTEPQAVIFYGTNWTTEDAVVAGTGMGMFRGMVGRKVGGATWQSAASVIVPGDAHLGSNSHAILMCTTGGGVYYRATVTLNDNGFTAVFDTGVAGIKIIALILAGAENVVAVEELGGNETHAIGFRARSHLSHGGWAFPIAGSDRTQEFYGGGAFMHGDLAYKGCGIAVCSFPTSQGQQALSETNVWSLSNGMFTTTNHFTGPFLTAANVHLRPETDSDAETDIVTSFDFGGGMSLVWDGWSDLGYGSLDPDEGDTYVKTGLEFEPAALVAYTVSDENVGQQGDGTVYGAIGFSVVVLEGPGGEPFQWTAIADGRGAGAFQSFERGFASAVDGSTVHAGTIELTEDGFIATTEEDGHAPGAWVWHAFGIPAPLIPTIYRHGIRYR